MQAINMQQAIYNKAKEELDVAAKNITDITNEIKQHPDDKTLQARLTQAQTEYNNVKAAWDAYIGQADGFVQAEQTQVGQDSSAMTQKMTGSGVIPTIQGSQDNLTAMLRAGL
jgi:hypothetical protein